MASGFGITLADAILNLFKNTAPSAYATVYCALYTANPSGTSASGTEVTGGSYARTSIAAAGWTGPTTSGSNRQLTNTGTITFPTATGNWGTVTGIAIYDAATVGNELWWGVLTTSQAVNTGNVFTIPATSLVIQAGLIS